MPRNTSAAALFIALGLLTAGRLFAASGPVDVLASAAGISWQPSVPHGAARLVVAGPHGRVVVRRFEPGEGLFLAPVGDDGLPLADGVYRWELRLGDLLSPEVAEALRAADLADDDEAALAIEATLGKEMRASGRFRVNGGTVSVNQSTLSDPANAVEASPEPRGGAVDTFTITGLAPRLILEDTDDNDFSIGAAEDELTLNDQDGADGLVGIAAGSKADSLFIAPSGIGLFNAVPDSGIELHIQPETGDIPNLRLEDTGMISPAVWEMRIAIDDLEIVENPGVSETVVLELNKLGAVYDLEMNGNATIEGDVAMGSSREIKTDLVPASPDALLAQLIELDLFTWRYKTDEAGATHLGPVAEDFHALFGLGRDERHISPGDSSGLALASVQALYGLLQEKEREIVELRGRLESLESRLDAVEPADAD